MEGRSADIAVAGNIDVNSDGQADLYVGAPGNDMDGQSGGSVYLILGAIDQNTGLSDYRTRFFSAEYERIGSTLAVGFDLTGDDVPDAVAGGRSLDASITYLLNGSERGEVEVNSSAHRGEVPQGEEYRVAPSLSISDVDGDGLADLVVGNVEHGADVYGGPINDLAPETALVRFDAGGGYCQVDAGGDADGDGHTDLLISAYRPDQWGEVRILRGPIRADSRLEDAEGTIQADLNRVSFRHGGALDVARFSGDVDFDGRSELLVGVDAGAYVFRGMPVGVLTIEDADTLLVSAMNSAGGTFPVGDIDSDGAADAFVGGGESLTFYPGSLQVP